MNGATALTGATPSLAAPPVAPATGLELIDALLRDRDAVLDRIERGEALGAFARTMVVAIALATAVVGATLGAYRGGVQILFAAVKLPLVVLLTAGLCTPAFTALEAAVRGRADLRRDLALVLATLALGALLLSATAPLMMLAMSLGVTYHGLILLTVGCSAAAGLGGLSLFARGQARRGGRGSGLVALCLLALFAVVGAQMSWTLRPYVVRPRTPEVPFVRAIEGSFLDSVRTSLDSFRGRYRRGAAPLPGDLASPPDIDPHAGEWRDSEGGIR